MIKRIQSYLKTKLGIDELAFLQKRQQQDIQFLTAYINLVNSDILSIPEDIETRVKERIFNSFNVSGFNTKIHKNDIMFAGMLSTAPADLEGILHSYFKIGADTATKIRGLLKSNGANPQSILDFGSGYGRVSRFLPSVFPSAHIFVSDVKTPATNFLREEMNMGQIIHNEHPSSFPKDKFDVIFALSVFTHLPENTFKTWMDVLINSLTPGGTLIFTFNHIQDSPNSQTDFYYNTQSEEKKFAVMPDSINDENQYGSTWVSPDFLHNLLGKHDVNYTDLKRSFVKSQNAFLVTRK